MKLTKREIKYQRDLYNKISTGTTLTPHFIDLVYGGDIDGKPGLNPAIVGSTISEGGVYWSPYGMSQDLSVFAPRRGHILDLCSGIGMLAYRLQQMDSYDKDIESITCIEYDPAFVEIGKKILPSARWIYGNAFDKKLLDDLVKDLPDKRFDLIISNPPFGVDQNKGDYSWLNYQGHRDLMALEIALRYGKWAYFILPTGSCPFEYSTSRAQQFGYINDPERYSQKFKKFLKENKDIKFNMEADGIDCSIYKDQWVNLPGGIGVEVCNVTIHPWSMDCEEDSIHNNITRKGYSLS